jgi:hypothetical protein
LGELGSGLVGSVGSSPHSAVGMVVALLLAGIDAVDADRVQQVLDAVGVAHEAAAAYENDRVAVGHLDVLAVSAGVPTGNVGDLDPLAVKQHSLAEHLP